MVQSENEGNEPIVELLLPGPRLAQLKVLVLERSVQFVDLRLLQTDRVLQLGQLQQRDITITTQCFRPAVRYFLLIPGHRLLLHIERR